MTKTAEKQHPLGRTYLYGPYKGVPPPGVADTDVLDFLQTVSCSIPLLLELAGSGLFLALFRLKVYQNSKLAAKKSCLLIWYQSISSHCLDMANFGHILFCLAIIAGHGYFEFTAPRQLKNLFTWLDWNCLICYTIELGLITKEQFCSFIFVAHQPFQTCESFFHMVFTCIFCQNLLQQGKRVWFAVISLSNHILHPYINCMASVI